MEEDEIERELFLNNSSRYEYCFWYTAKRIIGIRKEKTFLVLILNYWQILSRGRGERHVIRFIECSFYWRRIN